MLKFDIMITQEKFESEKKHLFAILEAHLKNYAESKTISSFNSFDIAVNACVDKLKHLYLDFYTND